MCQTAVISDRIVNLGTRSYRQRLEAISGIGMTTQKLSRLNRDLEDLYEVIYSQFNAIKEKDRLQLNSLLHELLKALKALYATCKKIAARFDIGEETERLEMNYSALYEIHSDINNFRSGEVDDEMSQLLFKAANIMQNVS